MKLVYTVVLPLRTCSDMLVELLEKSAKVFDYIHKTSVSWNIFKEVLAISDSIKQALKFSQEHHSGLIAEPPKSVSRLLRA